MIRKAEPRDLPAVYEMFLKLTEYLEEKGQTLYAKDIKQRHNAIMGFIVGKFYHEQSLILVSEDSHGGVNGFLIGEVRQMEPFFEHQWIAEIQWTYPLSLNTRQFARQFEEWGRGLGATAGSNYHTPGNEFAGKMMEHEGRRVAWHYYTVPFKDIDTEPCRIDIKVCRKG